MVWGCEDFLGRSGFDDLAAGYDGYFVGYLSCCGQFMGDEECSKTHLGLQLSNEGQNSVPDSDVQSADGFVEDDELGVDDERTGNCCTLKLSSGEFMGKSRRQAKIEVDETKQFSDAVFSFSLRTSLASGSQRFSNGSPDHLPRVECRCWVLQYCLNSTGELATRTFVVVPRYRYPTCNRGDESESRLRNCGFS